MYVVGGRTTTGEQDGSHFNKNEPPFGLGAKIGSFGNYVGTPISPRHFIVVNHINDGQSGGWFLYSDGIARHCSQGFHAIDGCTLWQIDDGYPNFPDWVNIYTDNLTSTPPLGLPVVAIGNGTGVGGWVQRSWGQSVTTWMGNAFVNTRYDASQPDDFKAVGGDSGSPQFVLNPRNQQWELLAVTVTAGAGQLTTGQYLSTLQQVLGSNYIPYPRGNTDDMTTAELDKYIADQVAAQVTAQIGTYIQQVQALKAQVAQAAQTDVPQQARVVNAATFVKQDITTGGTWQGKYGAGGYDILGGANQMPAGVAVAGAGYMYYPWAISTNDVRCLFNPANGSRVAACWYSAKNFGLDINLTDGKTHQVALYCLDFDKLKRAQTIDVLDADTNAVLASQQLANFGFGTYVVFSVQGHVRINLTNTAGPDVNAVLSGIFID